MFDWLIHIYRRTSRITRRVMTIILAGVIALSTMHVLTLPAVTLTEDTAGEDPGIVLDGENGTDPAEPSEDPAVIEVTPEPEPTPEETYIPEPTAEPSFEPAPDPTPEVTPVPAETPMTTEEPTAVPTEEPTPETTATPEPTATPEMTPVPSETPEATSTPEVTPEPSEEPEETAEPTAEPVPDMTEEEEEELAENQLVSEEDLKDAEPAADPEADRESAEYWMSMFSGIELSGVWADDLITIAESQIGYHESTRNFVVANNRHYGYSRYGAWYGSPYGDWCAMFVSYCLNYAGIPREAVPYEAYCPRWIELLAEQEMYVSAGEYVPAKGDLIFFDWNRDATADHVGLVKAVEYEEENSVKIITIEGNSSDAVHQNTYAFDDNRIMGYGILPENPELTEEEPVEEPEETVEYRFLNGSTDTVEVSVMYETDALPEGVQLVVTPVEQDDVLEAINGAVTDKEVMHVEAVDITFLDQDGNPVEPTKPIKVTMMAKKLPVQTPAENPVVVHVDDDLNTDIVESNSLSSETATFDAEHFSVYAMVYTVETYYTTADGETYKITVAYDSMSGIPQDVELRVSEITEEDEKYGEYLAQAAEAAGTETALYARFFDIELYNGEEKIEPVNDVSVGVTLTDKPDTADEMKIVHFTADGVKLLTTDEQPKDDADVSFVTDSFSVYGVIVEEGTGLPANLNGQSVKIGIGNNYLTNETNYNKTPWEITKTNNINNAAEYTFEATGTAGVYNIYTMVNGTRYDLHINQENNNSARVNLTNTGTMGLRVTQNSDGTYGISRTINGTTYYLNQYSGDGGSGFAGWNNGDDYNSKLNFVSDQPGSSVSAGQYMVIAKVDNHYYIVNNDGTLTVVEYNETTKKVKVETPMLWTYRNGNLMFNSEAVDFDGSQVASDYYRRYIDPDTDQGWSEDDETNTTKVHAGYKQTNDGQTIEYFRVGDNPRQMETHSKLTYDLEQHRLISTNDGKYIGVISDADGTLRIAGNKNSDEAAEIFFARAEDVEPVDEIYNTVSHIDISIEGSTNINVPLAYGKYYDADGNEILNVSSKKTVTLTKDHVGITSDDMKKAQIVAYTKDANGTATVIDDAFVITGYSANETTAYSTDQVRIEGSFKVADVAIDENRYRYDANYRNQINNLRLQNKVYYSVTATKPVTFDVKDDQGRQLYDADGKKLTLTVDVAFSASFDYWDERNECPPVKWSQGTWRQGQIIGGSGMDFVLGGDAEQAESNIYAVEITKLIVDESGKAIRPAETERITNTFNIWRYADGNPNSVIGLNIDEYSVPADYSNYLELHSKNLKVGTDGMGLVYDYDVSPGMLFIQEDKNSIPDTIRDVDGESWNYVGTRIETEYPWRDIPGLVGDHYHVSDTYTKEAGDYRAIPEVLGYYNDINGKTKWFNQETGKEEPLRNGFLEFYVYNIYEPEKTDLKVEKEWEGGEAPANASIDVVLKRYKLIPDGSVTPPEPTTASLTISDSYSGLGGERTYSASYHVTGPDNYDQTFTWTGSPITIQDLLFGEYTVTKTAAEQEGYDATNLIDTKTITLGVAGASVAMTPTQYTRQSSSTTYHHVWVHAFDTLNQGTEHIVNGHYTYEDNDYPEGTVLSFTMGVPGWNNNSTYSYSIDGGTQQIVPMGETRTAQVTVDRDIEIVIYGKTPYYSQWLSPEPSVSVVSSPKNARRMLGAPRLAATVLALTNSGSNPAIEGYTWQEDTTWNDGNGLTVHLPDSGLWEKTVEDLEKEDAYGNVYVYYIDSVTENNMPSGTQGSIVLDGDNKLFVYGDHKDNTGRPNDTLNVKNILSAETQITIYKVKKGTNEALTGAVFRLTPVDETGTPITGETPVERSVDSQGKLVFTGLTAGRYMLEEITVPTGYAKTETVHYIDVDMNGNSGLPTGIEYKLITETENNVYKVENEPLNVPVRFLKIDQDGKPLAGAKFSLYKDAYDASGTPEAEAANRNHLVQKDLISHLVGEGDNQVAEIAMKDLNPGTYYLVETEAPNGYYNNGIIKIVVTVTTTVSDENTNDTVSVTAELAGNPVNDPRDFYMTDDGTYVLRVMNTQGYELPHTGGNGTAAIYLTGLMLVLLSGMLYSRRKRLAMSGHGISESERSGEKGGGARL